MCCVSFHVICSGSEPWLFFCGNLSVQSFEEVSAYGTFFLLKTLAQKYFRSFYWPSENFVGKVAPHFSGTPLILI